MHVDWNDCWPAVWSLFYLVFFGQWLAVIQSTCCCKWTKTWKDTSVAICYAIAHIVWLSTCCSLLLYFHSLPVTNCLLCFSLTLPPPISPPLSQPCLLFCGFLCPPGSRGGVSEEDAGFRARCCRRMALRIQGKGPPLLYSPSWLISMKCSSWSSLGALWVLQLWWKGVWRAQVIACHLFNISALFTVWLNSVKARKNCGHYWSYQCHSFTETCLCLYVNYEQVLHTQAFIHIAVIPYFLHSVNLLKLCKSCYYHHYCHVHPLS